MNTDTKPLAYPRTREIRDAIAAEVALQVADKAIIHKPHDEKTWEVQGRAHFRAGKISALLDILHARCGRPACHGSGESVIAFWAKRCGWTLEKPAEA